MKSWLANARRNKKKLCPAEGWKECTRGMERNLKCCPLLTDGGFGFAGDCRLVTLH